VVARAEQPTVVARAEQPTVVARAEQPTVVAEMRRRLGSILFVLGAGLLAAASGGASYRPF